MAGGTERDEVYVKYKCGTAPEVAHFYVLLYMDRLLARPVEVWQVRGRSMMVEDRAHASQQDGMTSVPYDSCIVSSGIG